MDIVAIANAVAGAILAESKPGAIPPFELTLRCFCDVYEKFDELPTESRHLEISEIVGALIRAFEID